MNYMTRSPDLDKVAPDDTNLSNIEKRGEALETQSERQKVKNIKDKIYDIVGHTKHSLSSLLVNPDVFSFEEKDSREEILVVARPHWFTNFSWIFISGLMLIAPGIVKFIPIVTDISGKYLAIGVMVWYLLTFAIIFESFLSWYFDVFIITDKRVIDIDFNNLLDKKFSEARLSMIQDVTSRVSGVAQTMFNFGTVHIQTAAEVSYITFEEAPHPEKIIKILQLLREDEEIEKGGKL